MDRIDAMKVFVTALDAGSLAGAGRTLGRSPAAVGRAVTYLEEHVGVQLLHRTTRLMKPSEAGKRYADACRRMLTDLKEAEILAAGERSTPRGTLTLSAPVLSGEEVLRPILDAFLDAFPEVSANLHLLDRSVNLIDEGIDAALRIGHLPELIDGRRSGRRSPPGRRRRAILPCQASAHRSARRSREAANYRREPFWLGLVELPAYQWLDGFARCAVRAPPGRRQRTRGGGLGRRRTRRDAAFVLSGRRICEGRATADRAAVGRVRPHTGPCHLTGGPTCRSEGPRLRRLRRAALAGTVRRPRCGCRGLIRQPRLARSGHGGIHCGWRKMRT